MITAPVSLLEMSAQHAAELITWFAILVVFYTYFGYPLLTLLLSLFLDNAVNKKDIEPTVTFLITAYNEEKNIEKKLQNTLSLDYPRDKLEIMVASDGSTDRTDEIVKKFSYKGVVLHRVEGRVGKTETQNQAVEVAEGDIVIFSDATTTYKNDAIRKIVRNYNDTSIGAVSGRYEYVNPTGAPVGLGTILFWKYENFIKSRQTRIKTITGCCGCIYSVLRSAYEPLPRTIISDLVKYSFDSCRFALVVQTSEDTRKRLSDSLRTGGRGTRSDRGNAQ